MRIHEWSSRFCRRSNNCQVAVREKDQVIFLPLTKVPYNSILFNPFCPIQNLLRNFVWPCALVIAIIILLVPIAATEISISPGTPHIINMTIARANAGDTIILNPGTYYENNVTIKKDITIRANVGVGGNAKNTLIDAQGTGRIFYNQRGISLTLDNLTLIGGQCIKYS